MGSNMGVFFDALKLQDRFIQEVAELELEKVDALAAILSDYLKGRASHKSIHVLSKGRSALSAQAFLQGLYNEVARFPEYRFYPATLRDGVIKFIDGESLTLVASGSGETKEVLRYLETATRCGSRLVLITGKRDSSAYKMVTEAGGEAFVMESQGKYDGALGDSVPQLSPLGSEFELKVWVLLNSLIPEVLARLRGEGGKACTAYRERLGLFQENVRLLHETRWVGDEALCSWIDRLTNRHGLYVFYGVTRSGNVAEQFEMRFAHANKSVFMLDDSNRKPFRYGDACILVSGSGNTDDVVDAATDALGVVSHGGKLGFLGEGGERAQVFAITVNQQSRLRQIMEFAGQGKNLLHLPVKESFLRDFTNSSSNSIINPSELDRFRIPVFETSAYVVTNAIVAQVGHNEGIIPQIFFKGQHV